jgi:hypothetical protein
MPGPRCNLKYRLGSRFLRLFLVPVFLILGGFLSGWFPSAWAASSLSCTSPTITLPSGGGTGTANVDCTVSATGLFSLGPVGGNYVTPATVSAVSGSNSLNGLLLPGLSTPDNSYTAIVGTSAGFVGVALFTPATIRYQYTFTSTATTPAGTYSTSGTTMTGAYRTLLGESGSSNFVITVNVPLKTTTSCTSPSVNATGGGGAFTLNVDCTLTGNGPLLISPSVQNTFSPTSITLSNGPRTLNATLQATVTSPNASIIGITGAASTGFSGTFVSSPATIRVQYTGTTTSTTHAGTYTSPTVTYAWSTL